MTRENGLLVAIRLAELWLGPGQSHKVDVATLQGVLANLAKLVNESKQYMEDSKDEISQLHLLVNELQSGGTLGVQRIVCLERQLRLANEYSSELLGRIHDCMDRASNRGNRERALGRPAITLHQHYAGLAMQALVPRTGGWSDSFIAARANDLADAMIEATKS